MCDKETLTSAADILSKLFREIYKESGSRSKGYHKLVHAWYYVLDLAEELIPGGIYG